MAKILRPYQELALTQIDAEIAKGNRAVCFVLGTGLGKTATLAEGCFRHLAQTPNGKVLWLVHREELVSQAFDALTDRGLLCGVVMANPTRTANPWRPVQVASIQTLLARKIEIEGITYVVHDEAHHGPSKSWIALPQTYKARGAILIGPTATPIRADGIGLGDIYDVLVEPIRVREAISRGYLCRYEIHRPPAPLRNDEIAESPVDSYRTYANGGKAIVFAPHVNAAKSFLDEFTDAGIPAVFVDGTTQPGLRRARLEAYATGKARVLINVGIATEGFDDPGTSCIILARAVGSISLYLQILGRGLRIFPGKPKLIIVDLHGSSWIHGTPEEDADGLEREWSLEGEALKKAKDKNPERFCAICGVLLDAESGSACDLCCVLRPELVPPTVVNVKLVAYAAKRRESSSDRAKTLARWISEARSKGHKPGASSHKYKAVYGEWPAPEVERAAKIIINAQTAK